MPAAAALTTTTTTNEPEELVPLTAEDVQQALQLLREAGGEGLDFARAEEAAPVKTEP